MGAAWELRGAGGAPSAWNASAQGFAFLKAFKTVSKRIILKQTTVSRYQSQQHHNILEMLDPLWQQSAKKTVEDWSVP